MIERLASQTPTVNEQARKQIEAGQKLQLQQTLAAAPVAPTSRVAQAVAPQATAQAVNTNLAVGQQNQQQVAGLAGQALNVKSAEAERDLAARTTGLEESTSLAKNALSRDLTREESASDLRLSRDDIESTRRVASLGMEQDNRLLGLSLRQKEELSAIGRDIKAKIFDARLQFEKDEVGRKFSNERQLADYALANAKTQMEFDSRTREIKQASDRKMQLLEHTNNQLTAAIERGWLVNQQKLDFEHKKYLIELKRKLEEEMAKEKARNANRMMVYQGVGTLAGAAVGAAIAGPGGYAAGAAAGAAIGGSVGTMAAGSGV